MCLPFLLSMVALPALAAGNVLLTTMHHYPASISTERADAIVAGFEGCSVRALLPRDVFASLGVRYSDGADSVPIAQVTRLRHPLALGDRISVTDVAVGADSRGQTASFRFSKSLVVHEGDLPDALRRFVPDAQAAKRGLALEETGRVLSCAPARQR